MTDVRRPGDRPGGQPEGLTCDEVRDLAASFVLGALTDAEMAAVREHLDTCAEPHPEIAELGGAVPILHASLRPMDPPAALRDRIMAAAAADLEARRRDAAATEATQVVSADEPIGGAVPAARPQAPQAPRAPASRPVPIGSRRPALSWALGIAAVLAIVLLGGWNVMLQSQLSAAQAYQRNVTAVVDAASEPGALTAVMRTDAAEGPSGLAAVTPDGEMRIAMRDLQPTSGDEVYEAWVIEPDSAPVALGGFRVGSDGFGYLEADGLPTDSGIVLALTREPRPGMSAPSSDPVSVGTATATT
jgi:hypothetical protein